MASETNGRLRISAGWGLIVVMLVLHFAFNEYRAAQMSERLEGLKAEVKAQHEIIVHEQEQQDLLVQKILSMVERNNERLSKLEMVRDYIAPDTTRRVR